MSRKSFIKGTLLLSAAGLATRLIGFFYRIFLSHTIGAEGIGLYQLLLPLQTLILSVSVMGIQMSISRLCAAKIAVRKEQEACSIFTFGTCSSVVLTAFLALCLFRYADFFATRILKEERCVSFLRIMAFSLPLSALHTCISSYYFARKDSRIPSFLQLTEQLVRFGITYLSAQILISEKREVTAVIAVIGSLAGEITSALIGCLAIGIFMHSRNYRLVSFQNSRRNAGKLFSMAVPLSLNRILLTLLGSMEVVLIPQQLHHFGLNASEALAVYGIFTGMALPLIMFPATITGSVSVMLMPSVAELQALGYHKRITYVSKVVCQMSLLLGVVCLVGFFLSGNYLGIYMFHNAAVGDYIRSMAFLCPFLYLHTTLSSILHGLGHSSACLLHNLIGAGIRLGFVIFSIPHLGIRGYLYGLLVSEMFLAFLHLFVLQEHFKGK